MTTLDFDSSMIQFLGPNCPSLQPVNQLLNGEWNENIEIEQVSVSSNPVDSNIS